MVFRIGSSLVRGGIIFAAPKNYGRATQDAPVQNQLDHYTSIANTQFLESLKVDGTTATYWHRCTEGFFCTCHDPKATSRPHLVTRGNIDVDQLNSQNREQAQGEAANGSPLTFTTRGALARLEREFNSTETGLDGSASGNIPAVEGVTSQVDFTENTSGNSELLSDFDDDGLLRMGSDAAILFGGERTQCGICFGTGYVNGYSLACGRREIFDASGQRPVNNSSGFFIQRGKKPFTFRGAYDTHSFVEWVFELPTYFLSCATVAVRNNTVGARYLNVMYKVQGSSGAFAPLTPAVINSFNGTTTTLIIRVVPQVTSMKGIVEFTHLEITMQFSDWPLIDMPPLGESTNFGVFDSLQTTEFTLPPTLVNVSKEDVVYEYKYNRLWKITDVTDFQTAKRIVLGWTASARIVQDYEQVALLRLTSEKNFALSYSDMKTTGSGTAAEDQYYADNEPDLSNLIYTEGENIPPPIPAVTSGALFTFVQTTPSTVWYINHNLNTYPSVTIIDSEGNIVMVDVTYVDSNNVTVTFGAPAVGSAYLN